jgi:hypothetical protein
MPLDTVFTSKDTIITLTNKDSVTTLSDQRLTIIRIDNTPPQKNDLESFAPYYTGTVALLGIIIAWWNIKRQVTYNAKQQWINDFRATVVEITTTLRNMHGQLKEREKYGMDYVYNRTKNVHPSRKEEAEKEALAEYQSELGRMKEILVDQHEKLNGAVANLQLLTIGKNVLHQELFGYINGKIQGKFRTSDQVPEVINKVDELALKIITDIEIFWLKKAWNWIVKKIKG